LAFRWQAELETHNEIMSSKPSPSLRAEFTACDVQPRRCHAKPAERAKNVSSKPIVTTLHLTFRRVKILILGRQA
jgi:hypothetical protein